MEKILFSVLRIFLILVAFPLPNYKPISVNTATWEPIQGPTISGGTITQLIIDPQNPSHIYAFQQQQDLSFVLFESIDAASSWNVVFTFKDFIDDSSIDPANPSILYSGTSDSILRSVDSGRNWEKIADYGPVIASPAANTLYSIETLKYSDDCSTGNVNFVVSHDRGNTWGKYFLGCYFIHQIATTYSYPQWIYIRADTNYYPTLYRSNDGGDTWITIPLTGTWFTHGFEPIAIDPDQPEKLYTSSGSGIIISTNGGLTWQSVLDTPVEGPIHFSFSSDDIYAGVDSVVYGESPVTYRSLDGGETWEHLPWTVPDRLNDLQVVCRECSSPSGILVGLEGFGVYKSINSGETWQPSNQGMRSTVIVDKMAVSPSDPNTAYTISNWPRDALIKTNDGGVTWSEPLLETMIFAIVVNANNPDIVWVADGLGIQESLNGGESWRRVSTIPVQYLAISPNAPERPCAVGNTTEGSFLICRVISNQTQEYQWVQSPIQSIQAVGQLTISPTQGNLMMLCGRLGDSLDYSVFMSGDNGLSWEEILHGPKDYFPLTLAVSGGEQAKVFAVFFQFHPDNLIVYQSLDSGKSWQDITNQLAKAGGEMWTGWTYKAPVVIDKDGVTFFGTRNVILQQMGDGQTWRIVWNYSDLIQDMIILPDSQDFLLVSSNQSLWKSPIPIFRSIWMPILYRQP